MGWPHAGPCKLLACLVTQGAPVMMVAWGPRLLLCHAPTAHEIKQPQHNYLLTRWRGMAARVLQGLFEVVQRTLPGARAAIGAQKM